MNSGMFVLERSCESFVITVDTNRSQLIISLDVKTYQSNFGGKTPAERNLYSVL